MQQEEIEAFRSRICKFIFSERNQIYQNQIPDSSIPSRSSVTKHEAAAGGAEGDQKKQKKQKKQNQ